VMAMAQGVVRGPTDLAAHAETLSPAQLRALKFGADPQTREIGYPKKTVFRMGLHQIDDELLEQVLLGWQSQVLGPWQDQIVIVEGIVDMIRVFHRAKCLRAPLRAPPAHCSHGEQERERHGKAGLNLLLNQ